MPRPSVSEPGRTVRADCRCNSREAAGADRIGGLCDDETDDRSSGAPSSPPPWRALRAAARRGPGRGAARRAAERGRDTGLAAAGRRRRRARRSRLGRGPAPDRLLADDPVRGRPGLRADRGPHRLHRRHALLRCRVPRLRPVRHRGQRQPPRLAARRDGRLPDRPRHLPRPPERLRLRHEPRRPRVRRAGDERGPGRRVERPRGLRRLAHRLQPQLGRGVGREDAQRRLRVERRVRDPVHHAALRARDRPRVGPEPAAQRAPAQRELVLGAAPPPVRPVPGLAGGRPGRPRAPVRSATSSCCPTRSGRRPRSRRSGRPATRRPPRAAT